MTDSSKVHYLFIIDRSGSMADIRDDMESGLQAFIDRQLLDVDPAKRTVTLHQFDTQHDLVYDYEPLENAKGYKLNPRGGTALLDACGTAIKQLGVKLKHMPESERPGYVMVLIVTDGEENSSHTYSRSDIKEMIQHQTDTYNWKFSYLGANQDAFAEAGSIGIIGPSVLSWLGTGRSMGVAFASAGDAVSAGTHTTNSVITYNQVQRDAAMEK